MTFDLLEALEKKIEKAVDSITELQIKLDDAIAEKNEAIEANEVLKSDNEALVASQQQWQSRLSTLVEKMDQVDEAFETDAVEQHEENQENQENQEQHEQHNDHHHHEEHHHEHHHNY